MAYDRNNIVSAVKQSKPIDTREPYDAAWVAGKTIVITGGASGFGEGFFRKWAANGANVIIGDVNDSRGKALVDEVRNATGNNHLHYLHVDVANWQSQVEFFRAAENLSPSGGIDAAVANAGIPDTRFNIESSVDLSLENPPKPNLSVIDINLTGVLYTTHLAYTFLQRNTQRKDNIPGSTPGISTRDRHLLLVGSLASIDPLPGQPQYGASKHGVCGLFRALRATSHLKGIRVNMLCPYYIDTPLIPVAGRLLLAGGALGKPEDVVDAGTRFMADTRIVGRALAVGPRVRHDEDMVLLPEGEGGELATWEMYAHDFEKVDAFTSRFVRMVNSVEVARGWIGWASDIASALFFPLRNWWWRRA